MIVYRPGVIFCDSAAVRVKVNTLYFERNLGEDGPLTKSKKTLALGEE